MSQPTISRAITGLTPLLGKVLRDYVPTADDLDERTQYIVDGGSCSRAGHGPRARGCCSGKRKLTGMNVRLPGKLSMDIRAQSTEAAMIHTA